MATGHSSSKRKSSSSSLHKKHSKNPSKIRIKRSKSRRRNKSKKLRRRDASLSYSDDDSRNENSVPDSEDDHRRIRRARSSTRQDRKGSKKRAQKSPSSSKDRKGSPLQRKKKGSKRNGRSDSRKKTQERKSGDLRSRRNASVSSGSSGSRSFSTCSCSGESELGRPRGRSLAKEKDKRSSGKTSNGVKKSRIRNGSYSSCSRCSGDGSYRSEERLTDEYSSRRLRSVVTVTNHLDGKEGRDQGKDEDKEEIIYDYDDYPSCRSNDSTEGGRKRESAHNQHDSSDKRRKIDDLKGEEVITSNIRTTELRESGKEEGKSNHSLDMIRSTNPSRGNKSEVSAGIGNSDTDDLELTLRQKALENLRKFRGNIQRNTKTPTAKKDESSCGFRKSSTSRTESIQIESQKEGGRVVVPNVKTVSMPMVETGPTISQSGGKISDMNYNGHESRDAKQKGFHPVLAVGAAISGNPTVKNNIAVGNVHSRSTLATSRFKQETSIHSTLKQAPTSQGSPKVKLLEAKNIKDKNAAEISKTVPESSNAHGGEVNKACGEASVTRSTLKPAPTSLESPKGKLLQIKNIEDKNATEITKTASESSKICGEEINKACRETSVTRSTLKQAHISQESPRGKLLATKNIQDKNATEISKNAPESSNTHGKEVKKTCGSAAPEASSCLETTSVEHGTNESKDEAKGASQFEQKTMSVMRGGEMVQVNYKVYIPKKAPALARRQLQR